MEFIPEDEYDALVEIDKLLDEYNLTFDQNDQRSIKTKLAQQRLKLNAAREAEAQRVCYT